MLKVADKLNYHPNLIARSFVRGKSGNIGVIMPHIPKVHIFSVYYFSELLSGIGEALQQNGYNMMLFFHRVDEKKDNDYLKYFKGGNVEGCILLGTLSNDKGLLCLQEKGCKFCLINNYIKDSDISFVDIDNISGSYDAVKHLINLGHKKIAFLNGPAAYTNSIDRLAGYLKALKEGGIGIYNNYLLEGNYGMKSGYLSSEKILRLEPKPTAVFVANDRMASGLIRGLMEKGVRVPEEIAVIGYDDSDIATVIKPNLTTVKVSFFELGKKCGNEFVRLLKSESDYSFKIFLKPKLVIRESSGSAVTG